MVTQRIKSLLLFAIVILAVVILSSFLVIGPDGVTAQAQSNLSLFSESNQGGPGPWTPAMELAIDEQQEIGTGLTYQGVYTNPNALDFPGGLAPQEGQLEVVDDLEGEISVTSTFSGYEHIPASAFRSDGFPGAAVGYRFSVLGGAFPGGYVRNNSANSVCMAAPVYLPHGATVTEVSIFFMDDHPTWDMDNAIRLWRKSHTSPGNDADVMVDLNFPPIDNTIIYRGYTTSIASGTEVVSNDYGYYVAFCFHPSTGLQHLVYGWRVDYDMPP
jgi:hypothetical protein